MSRHQWTLRPGVELRAELSAHTSIACPMCGASFWARDIANPSAAKVIARPCVAPSSTPDGGDAEVPDGQMRKPCPICGKVVPWVDYCLPFSW